MAISAPAESLFSQVKNIVNKERNRLHASTIKLLAVLKARGTLNDECDFRDLDTLEDPEVEATIVNLSALNITDKESNFEVGELGDEREIMSDDDVGGEIVLL